MICVSDDNMISSAEYATYMRDNSHRHLQRFLTAQQMAAVGNTIYGKLDANKNNQVTRLEVAASHRRMDVNSKFYLFIYLFIIY